MMTDASRSAGARALRRFSVLVMLAALAIVEGGWTSDEQWRAFAKESLIVTSNVPAGSYSVFTKLSSLGINPFPSVENFSPALVLPRGITLDKSNNLWGTNCSGPTSDGSISMFSKNQLQHLFLKDNPTPTVFIEDQGDGLTLDCPKGLVFIRQNLYVASSGSTDGFPAIVEFSKNQLQVKGASTIDPFTYFVSDTPVFGELGQLAVDKKGNLFVPDLNNQVIYGWTPSSLNSVAGKGGNAAQPLKLNPDYILRSSSFTFLEAAAFDGSGKLWVSDHHNNQLYAFTPSQITENAPNEVPTIIISPVTLTTPTGSTSSLLTPTWLSFQSDGYLWVTNSHSDHFGSVAGFAANSIKTSGSPTPQIFFDSDPSGGNFDHPVSLTVVTKFKF